MATTEKKRTRKSAGDVTNESNPVGRPPKFKTVEELETMIELYFHSCYEEVWKRKIDENGVPTDEWEPVYDRFGNIQMRMSKPFTVSGLALFLGTTRRTLIDYEQRDDEFSHAIKKAKARCEEFAEEALFTSKQTAGVIFNLKNNYGWVDKQEIDANVKGQVTLTYEEQLKQLLGGAS